VGDTGWWNDLIGKTIDTTKYTVLAFNVPGNGFDGAVIENYLDFTARDIARIFIKGIQLLEVTKLYAIIGFCRWRNCLGNGRIRTNNPKINSIATDWKANRFSQLFFTRTNSK
jgi:homoserine O-acetyltransferase